MVFGLESDWICADLLPQSKDGDSKGKLQMAGLLSDHGGSPSPVAVGCEWRRVCTALECLARHICHLSRPICFKLQRLQLTLPRRIMQSPDTSPFFHSQARIGMVCRETVDGLGVSQIFAQGVKQQQQQVVICC